MRLRLIALGAGVAMLATGAIGYALGGSAKEPVKRIALGASEHPRGAKGRTLGLSRVVIKPGGEIDLHHHEGTQVAYIDSGVLTYSVTDGAVTVREGSPDDGARVVRKIKAGHSGRIRAGQWIVEQPSDRHSAANEGSKKIVIHLSTLLKTGAPPSTPVQ